MAQNTVMQTLYNKEFTPVYETKQSWIRGTVTTEGDVKGDNFIFIVEGAAEAAVTRGANGLIPYASDDQASVTCTLTEYHHLAKKNNFNIYASSVPQRESMQRRGVVSINQRTDQLLLAQMNATTFDTNGGAAAALSLAILLEGVAIINQNKVPNDGEIYGLLTPKAWAQAMKINQFASSDWVPDRPFMKQVQWRNWMGVKWAMHPDLSGVGTASANCFIYHKASLGHALNMGDMATKVGSNDEQDYSWARTSSYQGVKLIQGAGVVRVKHNDMAAL